MKELASKGWIRSCAFGTYPGEWKSVGIDRNWESPGHWLQTPWRRRDASQLLAKHILSRSGRPVFFTTNARATPEDPHKISFPSLDAFEFSRISPRPSLPKSLLSLANNGILIAWKGPLLLE